MKRKQPHAAPPHKEHGTLPVSATAGAASTLVAEGFGAQPDAGEMEAFMEEFTSSFTQELETQLKTESEDAYKRTTTFGFMDLAPFVRNGMEAIVQDSFTQCFVSKPRVHWNFTFYLLPLYYTGVFLRYCVLFPLRLLIVMLGMMMFTTLFVLAAPLPSSWRSQLQEFSIRLLANAFLMSWCAVVREHGTLPSRERGQIYVANHTSVIDVVLLLQRAKFSLTGQKHTGLIGFFQDYVLSSMDTLWFDRLESRDRHLVAKKIKEHCENTAKPPLLVFPEGTCVNNEYVVMFKRGAFELGTCIVPVAIRYNKIFVDAFWNSRLQSFPGHLFSLMTSWAVVCDVWYMDPQYRLPGESALSFAQRVKEMIAQQARLESVPWDGYLKYFRPKPEYRRSRQQVYERTLQHRFDFLRPAPATSSTTTTTPITTTIAATTTASALGNNTTAQLTTAMATLGQEDRKDLTASQRRRTASSSS